MSEDKDKEKDKERWGLFSGDNVVYEGSHEACEAEAQRRYEKRRKQIHDLNALRQRIWQGRGARDDDRDRF